MARRIEFTVRFLKGDSDSGCEEERVLKVRSLVGLEGKVRVPCNLNRGLGVKLEESESLVDWFIGLEEQKTKQRTVKV